ncbi:TnsD family Tn7-like transposition protein [Sphingomonas oryzagri]
MFRLAPAPREGETLYSVLARLGGYLNVGEAAPFMEGLVGRRAGIASTDLPGGLALLTRDLPDGMREAAIDRIIDRLTAFPFHTAFMPQDIRDSVRVAMRGDVTGIYTRLGLAAFKVRQPAGLQFCPDCIDDMEADGRDPWWRREHQLSGLPVCAIHGTILRGTGVGTDGRNRHGFVSASRHVCQVDAVPLIGDASDLEMASLRELAEAAASLLDAPPEAVAHGDRRDAYRRRLADVGLMRSASRLDVAGLHAAFRDRWGSVSDLIPGLELAVDADRSWLTAMVRSRPRAVHPLQHLMLIGMLDGLGAVKVDQPFGMGPWHCRNPIADHVGLPVIEVVKVRSDRGVAYGDFACSCGYLYTVARDADGSLGRPKYRSFGSSLAPALVAAIERGDGLRATARSLGLDPKTLMREAVMAGVEVPWGTKASGAVPSVAAAAPVTDVRTARVARRARPKRNWFAIDVRLRRSARVAIDEIMRQEPPVRVTLAEVERRIARRDWLVKRRAKLPQTMAMIVDRAEDADAFRRRRLASCLATAVAAGDLRPCEVLRVAGLPMSWLPVVRDAVAGAQRGRRAVA